ncbi:MAG: hypothetical protein KAS72_09610 [Phycisphaerales bacterium]|nr:hypothetical protein [Phycisphaerales bacterium]
MTGLKKKAISVLLLGVVLAATGCRGYFEITDPNSGRLYFTHKQKIEKDTGALVLRDVLRDIDVRMEEYEVRELTRGQYRTATRSLGR